MTLITYPTRDGDRPVFVTRSHAARLDPGTSTGRLARTPEGARTAARAAGYVPGDVVEHAGAFVVEVSP